MEGMGMAREGSGAEEGELVTFDDFEGVVGVRVAWAGHCGREVRTGERTGET